MNDKPITLQKLRISRRVFFSMFILREVNKASQHAAAMYQTLTQEFPMFTFSRTDFYKTVREMHEINHWIIPVDLNTTWKRNFVITSIGKNKQNEYYKQFYEELSIIKHISDLFFLTMTSNPHAPQPIPLTKEQQRFFSRLVNVRELVEYLVIRHLHEKKKTFGSEIRRMMKEDFGWQSSEGYFYNILHDMEEKSWIIGQWEGERRHTRKFQLTDEGELAFRIIEDKTIFIIRNVRSFVGAVLALFN